MLQRHKGRQTLATTQLGPTERHTIPIQNKTGTNEKQLNRKTCLDLWHFFTNAKKNVFLRFS